MKQASPDELLSQADITFINFYPDAIVPFVVENKDKFKKGSIVTDSCGIKTKICRTLEKEDFDFSYIGCTSYGRPRGFGL